MAQQPDILDVIAQNMIAVMTTAPDKRSEWFDAVQQIHAQANAAGDGQMAALLDAVRRLQTLSSNMHYRLRSKEPFHRAFVLSTCAVHNIWD